MTYNNCPHCDDGFKCDGCDDVKRLESLPSAEAVTIHEDGTLEIKVPNAHKVGRVLVMDTDSHIGDGLFYPDDAEAEWIPCSERLPNEDGRYLVTYPLFVRKDKWTDVLWYGKPLMPNRRVKGKCWYRSDAEWGDVVYDEVTAWTPLPKPYRKESEVEE